MSNYRVLPFLAATADGEIAARVFERACEIRRGLSTVPGQDMPKWNLFRQLEDLLEAIAPKTFPRWTVTQVGERAGRRSELSVLTDVLAKFNPTTTDMRKPFRTRCGRICTLT